MLLGFKPRFVDPIQIGTKVHTLRDQPKREPKIGETLHMYTGLRTRQCKHISSKEKLISKQIAQIRIQRDYIPHGSRILCQYGITVHIDGRQLSREELIAFVKYDGFLNVNDFCEFWFIGEPKSCFFIESNKNLYHWTDLRY